ncbi:serine kinase [Roseivivax sp. GX 12232]|uniref:HPr kinase/phosphorylase n=1 Tax=Roseivivax sp. GX 12232 TaxID=2900547 RepID=UPI001E3CBEF2|nr:serine kinase [Roseivivax sp. GX 12232]MCE0505737.1 serine kinase [Roseivivax sp. GX 12232]
MCASPTPGAPDQGDAAQVVHGSAVAFDGRACLILGPSGSGKSALALELLALGAGLIADDRVILRRDGHALRAEAPAAIAGLIEARGVGLLNAPAAPPAALALVVDLGTPETDRLPPFRERHIAGVTLPCLHNISRAVFAAAIRQYMLHGRKH